MKPLLEETEWNPENRTVIMLFLNGAGNLARSARRLDVDNCKSRFILPGFQEQGSGQL
jgi:hypothetical protein